MRFNNYWLPFKRPKNYLLSLMRLQYCKVFDYREGKRAHANIKWSQPRTFDISIFLQMISSYNARLDVKKNPKRFRILIFALLTLTSFCPAYFLPDGMGSIYFLSPNLILENSGDGGQEDLVLDPPDPSKGMLPASHGNSLHPGIHSFKAIFSFLFHAPVFGQKTAILRC